MKERIDILKSLTTIGLYISMIWLCSCGSSDTSTKTNNDTNSPPTITTTSESLTLILSSKEIGALTAAFGSNIDVNNLANYANQTKPTYITKNNAGTLQLDNAKATLGRVLFYDKKLSIDDTIACSSCHQQSLSFTDNSVVSSGVVGGKTTRHSMRLINLRFADEAHFFWNKRAATLLNQTIMPIQDFAEMGFSGTQGRPNLESLVTKLNEVPYYAALFKLAYGDTLVTSTRLQEALTHFLLSIQSFDAKYDVGRASVINDNTNFTNFTIEENLGKSLFLEKPVFDAQSNRISGGLGCAGCHRPPEFDIDPTTLNNGIFGVANSASGIDVANTRTPTLRNLVKIDGTPNSQFMHTGAVLSLKQVLNHYDTISNAVKNTNLDPRLAPNGIGENLKITTVEANAMIAFLKTLSGTDVYSNTKWSNPFIR